MAKFKVFTDEQGKKFAFDEKGNKLDEMEIKKRQHSGKDGDIALQNLKKQQATNNVVNMTSELDPNEVISAGAGASAPAPVVKKSTKQKLTEQKTQKDPSQEYQEAARKGNAGKGVNMQPKPNETPVSAPAQAPAVPEQKSSQLATNYVGNKHKDVANAKPGQIIMRTMPDGTKKEYQLKLVDINWSRKKLGMPEIDAEGNIVQRPTSAPALEQKPAPARPKLSAVQVTNKPNAEHVSKTNPDHKRESAAKRRILEEKKNTPYQHMSDNDYLHAVNSGSLNHPGLKVTPGADGYYNYAFN